MDASYWGRTVFVCPCIFELTLYITIFAFRHSREGRYKKKKNRKKKYSRYRFNYRPCQRNVSQFRLSEIIWDAIDSGVASQTISPLHWPAAILNESRRVYEDLDWFESWWQKGPVSGSFLDQNRFCAESSVKYDVHGDDNMVRCFVGDGLDGRRQTRSICGRLEALWLPRYRIRNTLARPLGFRCSICYIIVPWNGCLRPSLLGLILIPSPGGGGSDFQVWRTLLCNRLHRTQFKCFCCKIYVFNGFMTFLFIIWSCEGGESEMQTVIIFCLCTVCRKWLV